MCSILIFIKPDNNNNLDPTMDWKKFKAGDVIDINEDDGFYWGEDIQGPNALGWWKVVVVPGVQKVQLAYLLASETLPYVSLEPLSPDEVRHQKRNFAVSSLELLQPSMSLSELSALIFAKPPLPRLNVIG